MAINQVDLGPNSTSFTVGGETPASVLTAICNWLATHGWEVYDSYVSTYTYRVLRAPYATGTKYKYVRIGYLDNQFSIDGWETWNPANHTGTYQTNSNAAFTLPAALTSGCTLYLFASARYIYFTHKVASSYDSGYGAFEVMRENPALVPDNDTPAFFLASATNLPKAAAGTASICFPRVKAGASTSASSNGVLTSKVAICTAAGGSIYPGVYAAMPYPVADTPVCNRYGSRSLAYSDYVGRVYGLKFVPASYGSHMDTMPVKVDANGMTDPTGTDMDHIVIAGATINRIAIPL